MLHRMNPVTTRNTPTIGIGVQTAGLRCHPTIVIPVPTMSVSTMCLKIIFVGLARKSKSGSSGLQCGTRKASENRGLKETREFSTPRQSQYDLRQRVKQVNLL